MFPDRGTDSTSIDVAASLITKAKKNAEYILALHNGEDTTKIEGRLKAISEYVNTMTGVNEYRVSENKSILKRIDKQFETVCALMEKNGFKNIEEMTTYKFFHRLQILEKHNK